MPLPRDSDYERRRADVITDRWMARMEDKVDALTRLVYVGLGGLTLLILVLTVLGPVIVQSLVAP